jgi:D-alanyl-lipoteichoic acid acyltransferase DltB (MBOAT superfamily)
MLIVWLLTGFWHGAAWTFLLWGFYFGVLLLGERTIWGKLLNRLPSPLQHLYTMVLIVFGWVFFRSGSVAHAASYFSSLFGGSERGFWDGQTLYFLLEYRWELLIGILAALPVKDRIQTFLSVRAHHPSAKFLLTFGKTGLALLLFALSFLRLLSSGYNPFIYFRF